MGVVPLGLEVCIAPVPAMHEVSRDPIAVVDVVRSRSRRCWGFALIVWMRLTVDAISVPKLPRVVVVRDQVDGDGL